MCCRFVMGGSMSFIRVVSIGLAILLKELGDLTVEGAKVWPNPGQVKIVIAFMRKELPAIEAAENLVVGWKS